MNGQTAKLARIYNEAAPAQKAYERQAKFARQFHR